MRGRTGGRREIRERSHREVATQKDAHKGRTARREGAACLSKSESGTRAIVDSCPRWRERNCRRRSVAANEKCQIDRDKCRETFPPPRVTFN